MSGASHPKTILITGASGGIGSALAAVYAEPGNVLILQGRDSSRLSEVVLSCESKGARVISRVQDVRKLTEFSAWLEAMSKQEKIDLAFVNAGVNTNIGPDGEGERWNAVQALVEVNVLAAMATVDKLLPAMRARNDGQIALISSLAAYFGLPVTPSYCASKAAIKAYGEALRGWLGPQGIRVNVVMPGYVESQMCRDMPGPKPFLWPAERAARYIKRGLARNQPRISFPFPLNVGSWFLSVLPPATSERILRALNYGG